MNVKSFLFRLPCRPPDAPRLSRRCCWCCCHCRRRRRLFFSRLHYLLQNILFPNRIFIHLVFSVDFYFFAVPFRRSTRLRNTFWRTRRRLNSATKKLAESKIHLIHKKCKRKRIERSAHTLTHSLAHSLCTFNAMPCTGPRIGAAYTNKQFTRTKDTNSTKKFSWTQHTAQNRSNECVHETDGMNARLNRGHGVTEGRRAWGTFSVGDDVETKAQSMFWMLKMFLCQQKRNESSSTTKKRRQQFAAVVPVPQHSLRISSPSSPSSSRPLGWEARAHSWSCTVRTPTMWIDQKQPHFTTPADDVLVPCVHEE